MLRTGDCRYVVIEANPLREGAFGVLVPYATAKAFLIGPGFGRC